MMIMPVIVTMVVVCTIRWVAIMMIMPVIVTMVVVCTLRWVAIMVIMPAIVRYGTAIPVLYLKIKRFLMTESIA